MMHNESTAVDLSIGEDDSVELDLGVRNLTGSSGGLDFEDKLIYIRVCISASHLIFPIAH